MRGIWLFHPPPRGSALRLRIPTQRTYSMLLSVLRFSPTRSSTQQRSFGQPRRREASNGWPVGEGETYPVTHTQGTCVYVVWDFGGIGRWAGSGNERTLSYTGVTSARRQSREFRNFFVKFHKCRHGRLVKPWRRARVNVIPTLFMVQGWDLGEDQRCSPVLKIWYRPSVSRTAHRLNFYRTLQWFTVTVSTTIYCATDPKDEQKFLLLIFAQQRIFLFTFEILNVQYSKRTTTLRKEF